MALRQLMLSKKIEQRKASLDGLNKEEEKLETRAKELEQSIEECKTDEEIGIVEEEVTKLDGEREELQEKKSNLEKEIADFEEELEKINSNEPKNNNQESLEVKINVEEGELRMRRGKFFGGLKRESVNQLMAREDVKDFMTRTRELIGEKRAVSGAELSIPEVMLDLLRDNLNRYSKLIAKVWLKPVAGKARQNIAGAIPEGIWTEAVGKLNELELEFSQIEVDGYKVGGFVPVPNSLLEDSDINLANEIMDALGQAIGYALDKAILFGTGSKMPVGIATRLAQIESPSNWGKYAPEWTNLSESNLLKIASGLKGAEFFSELILKLAVAKANYSNGEKFWAMNSKTKAEILAKTITFNAAGALVASQNNTMPIIGGDIIELEFIADNDIIGGFGSLYLLAERAGAQLASSEHVRFIEDQTVFKGTARYDGAPSIGEGFVMVNIANTTPTTKVAFSPDKSNISDAYLSKLTIGSVTLSPKFDAAVDSYTATTTNASNVIQATSLNTKAKIEIKVNDTTQENGTSVTWNSGENEVKVTVTYGTTSKEYTVNVTKN